MERDQVLWGSDWDPLLEKDRDALLVKRMGEVVDGQYQKNSVESGGYFREHFFGVDARLLEMVKHLSDEQIDGADGARFLRWIAEALEQPAFLLFMD
jgi:pyruvate dehydrogenase complex dehydrogenase (E1) component